VKAAPFAYFAPDSVDEAVSLLVEHGDDAKVLAGGQSLMPLMALRLAVPAVVVDINRLPGLDAIERGPDRLRIGALVRHRDIESRNGLADECPVLGDAVPLIGHVAIRNRGTVVGSLTHADPAAEWPAVAIALDGRVSAVGPRGTRQIDAGAFFDSYLSNTLAPDELATHLELRMADGVVGSSFVELARRYGDFALCGVAAVLRLTPAGTIGDARVVVCGCGPTPLRIADCEPLLAGQRPAADLFESAADIVFESVDPLGDIHGSAEYRRHVTRVIARRALERAGSRATGETGGRG
jgi:carbon-monoxide dehydrogenase medium subunit